MNIVIVGLLLLFLLLLIIIFLNVFISLITKSLFDGAYFAETSDERLQDILKLAQLKSNDRVLDLGSGDGRVVLAIAQQGYQATGIEINPLLVFISKLKLMFTNTNTIPLFANGGTKTKTNTNFHQGDLWHFDTSPYSVVIVYGIPSMMKRLEKKLKKELKPGSRIISVLFEFPSWKYKRKKGEVYQYQL